MLEEGFVNGSLPGPPESSRDGRLRPHPAQQLFVTMHPRRRVAQVLRDEAPVIIGCSALRRAYRDRIRASAGGPVRFIHLSGSREVIAARMAARQGQYMPLSLLDSQFAALEPPGPDEAMVVDIDQPLAAIIDAIMADPTLPAAG